MTKEKEIEEKVNQQVLFKMKQLKTVLLNYSKWDNLNMVNRGLLIDFLGNKLLTTYKQFFINKKYNEFYLILKDEFELCYELIHKWSRSKLDFNTIR